MWRCGTPTTGLIEADNRSAVSVRELVAPNQPGETSAALAPELVAHGDENAASCLSAEC